VKWPTFEDLNSLSDELTSSVWTPGITGMAVARPTMEEFLKNRWGVDHASSVFIGLIPKTE
jgi:hypothetical protein